MKKTYFAPHMDTQSVINMSNVLMTSVLESLRNAPTLEGGYVD